MSKQCSSRASSGFDVFRPSELGYGVVRLVIQYCTSGCSQPLGLLQANPHYMCGRGGCPAAHGVRNLIPSMHVRCYLLAFVRIKPAWRGNKPKATPYAHKTWRGKPLMGGRESSPLRKGHARFHFIAGCWVDSKKNFLFFPIDIRRRSRTTRRRRRRYLFDPSFETRKRLIFC